MGKLYSPEESITPRVTRLSNGEAQPTSDAWLMNNMSTQEIECGKVRDFRDWSGKHRNCCLHPDSPMNQREAVRLPTAIRLSCSPSERASSEPRNGHQPIIAASCRGGARRLAAQRCQHRPAGATPGTYHGTRPGFT
ncbi:hypothetical protein L209DRAFT_38739 [Thermothelomyces heterothallicus CBS 203.75]